MNYLALLNQAKTVTPSRKGGGGRGRTSVPEMRFESDSNGRPRISINTGLKRRFIEDGTFGPYMFVNILDQLNDDGSGKFLFFFTFTEVEDNTTVSVNNAYKNGEPITNNGSYVTALTSMVNSMGRDPQEFYSTFSSDEIVRVSEDCNTYVVTITAKTDEELNQLIVEDQQKVSQARNRAYQRALDKETSNHDTSDEFESFASDATIEDEGDQEGSDFDDNEDELQ